MTVRLAFWDCPTCGVKGIEGPQTHCTSCGAPRPKNVKFYLTDESRVVNDDSELRKAKAGVDWVCSHCTAHNKAYDAVCRSCGNPKDSSDAHLKEKLLDNDGNEMEQQKLVEPQKPSRRRKAKETKNPPPKWAMRTAKIIIGLFVLGLIMLIAGTFSVETEVTVTGFEWEREIVYQKNEDVKEEDWSLPNDARLIKSYQAVHHHNSIPDGTETRTREVQKKTGTEKVKVGTRDLGNGYFEDVYEDRPVYSTVTETYEATTYRKEPVYKTKYEYYTRKWKKQKPAVSRGTNHDAIWPLNPDTFANNPNYKIDKKSESYFISFRDHQDEIQEETIEKDRWLTLKAGDKLKARKSKLYGIYLGLEED